MILRNLVKKATLGLVGSSLLIGLAACGNLTQDSENKDIFNADRDGQRRRPASKSELLWAISVPGCSGHLIAPNFMMTAAHCRPESGFVGQRFTSGSTLAKNNRTPDITVTEETELSAELDYAILKINWANGFPSDQKIPSRIATSRADVTMSTAPSQGDVVFTVGFPGDRNGAVTYSEGQAKGVTAKGMMKYNIGIINGSSGGPVYRKSDNMLVSLTNAGPRVLGDAGWDQADINNPAHWNFGVAMWVTYQQSAVLKDVFPNGRNRFVETPNAGGAIAAANISMALGRADPAIAATFQLHGAAPKSATSMIICQVAKAEECKPGAVGYTSTSILRTNGEQTIFKADRFTTLTPDMLLTMVALDSKGTQIGSRTVKMVKTAN